MKSKKQNTDFLRFGENLLHWYAKNQRNLPFRNTKDPYKIWICEIIFQQTRIEQGLGHYKNFIEKFPDISTLAHSESDEVLLAWKGLGYYSRAINLHTASKQLVESFNGKFPEDFKDILKLKGIGKYTAAAISSICYGKRIPAVDGNFYRVLSRLFADNYDISQTSAYAHYEEISLKMMPENNPGDFNQAMMDLGSEICKPKNPKCEVCPLNSDCLAFKYNIAQEFPVKSKKVASENLQLKYFFVNHEDSFLIQQRDENSIWKKLYEFPTEIEKKFEKNVASSKTVFHKLTHKKLCIEVNIVNIPKKSDFEKYATKNNLTIIDFESHHNKSFPKPLENFINEVKLQNN